MHVAECGDLQLCNKTHALEAAAFRRAAKRFDLMTCRTLVESGLGVPDRLKSGAKHPGVNSDCVFDVDPNMTHDRYREAVSFYDVFATTSSRLKQMVCLHRQASADAGWQASGR